MTAPLVLFALSLAALAAGHMLAGWSDGLLVAGPAARANLFLLLPPGAGPHRSRSSSTAPT